MSTLHYINIIEYYFQRHRHQALLIFILKKENIFKFLRSRTPRTRMTKNVYSSFIYNYPPNQEMKLAVARSVKGKIYSYIHLYIDRRNTEGRNRILTLHKLQQNAGALQNVCHYYRLLQWKQTNAHDKTVTVSSIFHVGWWEGGLMTRIFRPDVSRPQTLSNYFFLLQ